MAHDKLDVRGAHVCRRIGIRRRQRRAGAVAGGVAEGSRPGKAAGGAAAGAAAQQPAGVERSPHRPAAVHEHSRARDQRAHPAAGADVARAARAAWRPAAGSWSRSRWSCWPRSTCGADRSSCTARRPGASSSASLSSSARCTGRSRSRSRRLAISGLIITFGKTILLPLIGYTLFSWLAILAKNLHNFVGPILVVALPIMIVLFLHENLFRTYDWYWLKKGGGMLTGEHVPSGKANAGQKILFWLLVGALRAHAVRHRSHPRFPEFQPDARRRCRSRTSCT